MTAVIHCLHTWRHYLLGSKFVIKTSRHKRDWWQDFDAEFDHVMEYKPSRANLVADALSHKRELTDIR